MSLVRRLLPIVGILALVGASAPSTSGGVRAVSDPAPIPGLTWRQPTSLRPIPSADRLLSPTGVTRVRRGSWWGGATVASTGETVTFYVSDLFIEDESIRLAWVNWFAWLYHGSELSTVAIYQAPLLEVQYICGSTEVLGCYSPTRHILIFPGDIGVGHDSDVGAHEYAHHIAANRRNDPWDANDWGPKNWASYTGVCARVAAGTAFPGDEGDHYEFNPGEAFAEAYRGLNEQRGGTWAYPPLVVDSSFAPDAGSYTAALADVQRPWSGSVSTSWSGQFAPPKPPPPAFTKLNATVGPGMTISLTTRAGTPVQTLHAGVFLIMVRDVSAKDNLHLTGPGVNRKTGVTTRGTATWKLVLRPGTYSYRSDAHPALGGSFVVRVASFRVKASVPTLVAGEAAAAFEPQEQTISLPLDGSLTATISGTASATMQLLDPASGTDLVPATTNSLALTVCGHRSVLLRVSASQAGSFRVDIATP